MYYLEFGWFSKFGLQFLASSSDRIHIVVQKLLDPERDLNVTSPIASLPRPIFLWRKLWKFCLPITKYVRLYANQIANFADLEVQFLRYC